MSNLATGELAGQRGRLGRLHGGALQKERQYPRPALDMPVPISTSADFNMTPSSASTAAATTQRVR